MSFRYRTTRLRSCERFAPVDYTLRATTTTAATTATTTTTGLIDNCAWRAHKRTECVCVFVSVIVCVSRSVTIGETHGHDGTRCDDCARGQSPKICAERDAHQRNGEANDRKPRARSHNVVSRCRRACNTHKHTRNKKPQSLHTDVCARGRVYARCDMSTRRGACVRACVQWCCAERCC